MRSKLYRFDRHADLPTISKYVEQKVVKNLNSIKNSPILSDILKYEDVYINGVRYANFGNFERFFNINHLSKVFSESPVCDIHGDLTVENIICDEDSYYLIDPNTGNILDCPYLDLAKLFQSLHGGYEFLMRIREVSVKENRINFTFMRSSAYDELYHRFQQYILDTYGEQVLRQVYYHEQIHWLRLMPYKLNHLGERSLIFYAGMLMVLNNAFSFDMNCNNAVRNGCISV